MTIPNPRGTRVCGRARAGADSHCITGRQAAVNVFGCGGEDPRAFPRRHSAASWRFSFERRRSPKGAEARESSQNGSVLVSAATLPAPPRRRRPSRMAQEPRQEEWAEGAEHAAVRREGEGRGVVLGDLGTT